MSKIKVDQVESSGTNVKLAAKGSGILKVKGAGGADGTLQLSSGSNGVKLKSPPHSSGQSYTMILPDNNIVQDAFVKVKSVSGTGTNAVGQLEYATQATVDKTNLNASNFTSGKLASARVDSSSLLTGANGYGLTFISKGSVTVDNSVSEISFTNLDADSRYWVLGKNIKTSSSDTQNLRFTFLDGSNNAFSTIYGVEYRDQPFYGNYVQSTSDTNNSGACHLSGYYFGEKHGFVGEFSNKGGFAFFETLTYSTIESSPSSPRVNRFKSFVQIDSSTRGVKFTPKDPTTQYFQSGTEILLYKMEA